MNEAENEEAPLAVGDACREIRNLKEKLASSEARVRELEAKLAELEPGPRGRPRTIDRHAVKALFDHGLCAREIAKELGVSQSGVEKALAEVQR